MKKKKPRKMTGKGNAFRPFPRSFGKKSMADFDGGAISSNGGAMLLAEAERRHGVIASLAGAL